MVVLTQSQQEAIWEHLLTVVLQQPKDNDYWKVLSTAGITNVTDLVADQDDIDVVKTWYYDKPILDASGNPVNDASGAPTYSQYIMRRYEANMTFIVKDYIWKTAIDLGYSSSSDMKHTDYMQLTREGYDRMRTDPNYKMRRDRVTANTSNANNSAPGNNNNAGNGNGNGWDPIAQFKKSIKRDQSSFPILKNDDYFDTWNRGTVVQAKIQDVAEVLNANYTPITTEDKELFTLKQQFMYGVFEKALGTDKGKSIVRKHQDAVDAQKVYQEVKKHYTDSVKARFDSSKYLRYITTAKYDQSWTGTSQAFIIHWQEQARLYNSLVPASQKYKDNALLVLLQTAVDQSPELRGVYNMAQQLQAASGNVLDYDKYVTTLLSASTQLDGAIGTKTPRPIKSLDEPGWKRFKGIAKRQKKMFRMANQAKLRSFRTAPKYMYGYEIPRDYKHALELDARNGNDKWKLCTILEFEQLDEYDTFKSLGIGGNPEAGFKKIRVHLVYAAKHDGRHKARCVADGHLTDVPVDSVYSGVVSLRGIRMLLFLAELNKLNTWGTDIGNAYLEAVTTEKVYIIAGPEFSDRKGETLIIYKALYGLRSSGLQWHRRFSAVLRKEGFTPCKMEPDMWLREKDGIYEYVAVYVDDLAFAMHEPIAFADRLIQHYKFKLKGTGEIQYHLGCDFSRDKDGTLCMQPKKYIQRMVDGYVRMFGDKPNSKVKSPLEENDHPEVDTTDFLDADGIAKYQSLVGSMQWAISLGRMDISTACMTLSSFRSCPRQGHLDRAKRVVGYLSRMSESAIRFRTNVPDYSDLPGFEYDWDTSIYGDVREEIPHDAPKPLGNPVLLTHYIDANLYHDMLTRRSVTGILHFFNQTPIDWYSKKQGKVETAMYGSEFMAARTAVEKIMDLRITLRYLGVPIIGKSYMFGDNEAVVNSAAKIDSKLHKRHNALSFHRVREAIASRMVDFHHMPGKQNPADILSKHWAYGKVWQLLRPLLFWMGDTNDIA